MIREPNYKGIESLLSINNYRNKWYPESIDRYRSDLSLGALRDLEYYYKSNIAYNLQYLEYIELQLHDLVLSESLTKMLIKNYVITAASIVEIILYHLVPIKTKSQEKEKVFETDIAENKVPKECLRQSEEVHKYAILGYKIKSGLRILNKESYTFEQLISIVSKKKFIKRPNSDEF